jgi:glycosyltransferase involved in cell wall biosynthesis
MKRVYIQPGFRGPDRGDGGMRRVIDAMVRHLPAYGWEVTETLADADVVNLHGTALVKGAVESDLPIVGSSHGLYWTGPYAWDRWAHHANKNVLEICRLADEVTAPSEWVAQTLRRNLWKPVHTVWHGIEPAEWPTAGESAGYVLWNKARIDPVSDVTPLNRIAALMPDVPFVSTFGDPQPNVQIVNTQQPGDTGAVPYARARDLTMQAGVYLATTRETFGIGTLEAMAAGVPVVGWAWGGQAEFIKQNETGVLVPEGAYDQLAEAIRYALAHRDRLGAAARAHALEAFAWADRVQPYAEIFTRASDRPWRKPDGKRVSIIIPVRNGAATIADTIASALREYGPTDEILVGINPSTDDTAAVVRTAGIGSAPRTAVWEWPTDVHLSGNRNALLARAKGRYPLPLDADDQLQEGAVERLVAPLAADRRTDISFGGVEFLEMDGKRWHSGWPVERFSVRAQVEGKNQIPYASMYRRDLAVWRGGYRKRCRTAEDADFWIRCTTFGAAVTRVPGDTLLYANMRPDSLSATSERRNWWDWYPWSRDPDAFPFGAAIYSTADWSPKIWPHDRPRVTVIIPVGPGHEEAALTAVDSVLAQTMRNWELIVVADTDAPIPFLPPWVTLRRTRAPRSGVAAARNVGVAAARAPWLCFLDADDYLVPSALAELLGAADRLPKDVPGFIYPDFVAEYGDGRQEVKPLDDWSQPRMVAQAVHGVTALYPRRAFVGKPPAVRFDESLPGWEDWDLGFQLADQGWCAYHLARPLFVYRMALGQRREENYASRETNKVAIRTKWTKYIDGGAQMPCRTCGGRAPTAATPSGQRTPTPAALAALTGQEQLWIEYVGPSPNALTWTPPRSGHRYRFGGSVNRGYIMAADGDFFRSRPADFIVRAERPDATLAAADVLLQADAPRPAPAAAPEATLAPPTVESRTFLLRPELMERSVDDLRNMAREHNIAPVRMRKADLVDALLAAQVRARDAAEIRAGMAAARAAATERA